MFFTKIAGPIKITSGTNGADVEFPLPPRRVGSRAKQAQYTLKVVSASGTAPKLGFKLRHGPDGVASKEISSVATAAPPADILLIVDSGSMMLCEFIHPIPVAGGTATGDSVTIEVYEMVKPF